MQHILADGAFADGGDKILDDLEVDVGFEQRQTHFAQRLLDILFGQTPLAAQLFKDRVELFCQVIKHALSKQVGNAAKQGL